MLYNHVQPEPRPLKRPRLGVPDVYPQEPKQREDELNPSNVKNGFQVQQQISDEFGTARNSNISLQRLNMFCISINSKRNELNTLPDNGRKKQQINVKDNFWPVTGRSKGVLDMWFRDLAGTKPLPNLAKKAPSFNKKEEIFTYLCDHQVSMKKAMWFLKLSAAYTTTVTEQKIKKRQMPDPSIEWTATVIRVMKDLSQKLIEHFALEKNPKAIKNSPTSGTGASTSGNGKCSRCNRCSMDKAGPSPKCTKDKCAMMNKEKPAGDANKTTPKVKSLREKVLNRSLMKDARFREFKMTKRKMSAIGPPPAKRAKSTLRMARLKAAARNHIQSTLVQQQAADEPMANPSDPSTSTATSTPATNSSTIPPMLAATDEQTSAETKDRNTLKLTRKRLAAFKKRKGLPSISQIIADLLAKRAKKRAKQRLNDKLNDQAASTSNETGDKSRGKLPANTASQPSSSPSQAQSSTASSNTACTTTTTPSNQLTPTSQSQTVPSPTTTASSQHSEHHSNHLQHHKHPSFSPSGTAGGSSSSSTSSNHTFVAPIAPSTSITAEDFPTVLKHWKYCTRLCNAMCEESLLDRYEFLQWALELLDRMRNKSADDGFLKLFLPFIMQFLTFIVESERLSRRLAYLVCKKVGFMLQYVTEEDTIAVNIKKPPPPLSSSASSTCCDSNITNRLDVGLKIKSEPEIRAPLATRSASTRFKKVKMDPPTPPPIGESMKSKCYGNPASNPTSPSTASTSPVSKPISSMTPPTVSPPTPSPPSVSLNPMSKTPQSDSESKNVVRNLCPISTPTAIPKMAQPRQKPSAQFMETMLRDFLLCPHHRPVIMQLSAMIQVITLRCPGALVWCGLSGEERDSITLLAGGPLEYMPVLPSQLPMPSNNRRHNETMRKRLRKVEQEIIERSKHSEKRWIADKWQRKTIDSTINEVILNTLSILDAHCFDRLDGNNNNLASLYTKLFQPVEKVIKQEVFETPKLKETRITYMARIDEPIVKVLCEWAVSHQRFGEHRAMVVAWLLEKRQSDITAVESLSPSDDADSNDSVGFYNGLPIFQRNLMSFLDHDAPVLEDNCSDQTRIQFTNLVHLFCELIRHDVFSHDAYMCTLISRGELLTLPVPTNDLASTPTVNSNVAPPPTTATLPPTTPASRVGDDILPPMEFKPKIEELDDSNVDDDLDKILQNIKVDQQDLMDAPDSPTKIEPSTSNDSKSDIGDEVDDDQPKISRHYVYTKHFPLNQDDTTSQHDCNQRYILLFGVGKERDEKKHAVKKMAKEISKLYSKKFSMEMNEGGKVKKQSRTECNLEATMTRFQAMTYFDQHMVTWQCSATVLEMLSSFASGVYNYLPVQEHVAYLFDLMEACNNIYGLIDLCISIMKELPQVESQLVQKNSSFVKVYTTSLSLYIVGVLRRYHRCLLLSYDHVLPLFEGLCRVVKHVSNPMECTSAERCILIYLLDLYSSCSLLKSKPPASETFFNIYAKVKQMVGALVQPMPAECYFDPLFMAEIFVSPPRGGKIDPAWGRILNETLANRYNFVCNALIAVSQETDNDRLNDISIMCAEFTAHCNALASEWLGAFIALCGSSNEGFYAQIPEHIDIQKVTIHNSLAVFVSILVARRCFPLEKFIFYVALPALVNASRGGREISAGAEAGARLSCHLLFRLFKANEFGSSEIVQSPGSNATIAGNGNIKLSCDRHLLAATHKSLAVGPVLAVLKGILVVGDAMNPENHKQPTSNKRGNRNATVVPPPAPPPPPPKPGPIDISHILGTSDLLGTNVNDDDVSMQDAVQDTPVSLSEFADYVLKQIAYQEWVLERILQYADDLCQNGMLIDPLLTSKQAQRLLQLICFPEKEATELQTMDQSTSIQYFFQILDRWNMPILGINLQLMHKQSSNTVSETNKYLDAVARSAVEIYYTPKQKKPKKAKKTKPGEPKPLAIERPKTPEHGPGIWCVIPLLSKLPGSVQARIIKVAGQLMEKMNFFNVYRYVAEDDESDEDSDQDEDDSDEDDDEEEEDGKNNQKSEKDEQAGDDSEDEYFYPQPAKLAYREFFNLLQNCLKGHEDQRDVLLSSLHKQLIHFVRSAQEKVNINYFAHPEAKLEMVDALDLRLSLVGTLFDGIYRNLSITTDWSVLLAQLMCNGVVDFQTNVSLYGTVYDMLTTIIHASLAHDPYERDENKKHFMNLVKKVRKEIGEKASRTKQTVKQLLPIVRMPRHIIGVESNEKSQYPGIDLIDRVPGLRATEKQKVNTWDLIEGNSKNPAPLSWAWFGAVKMERRPMKYERGYDLLKYHTHTLTKPKTFFYEPLVITAKEPTPTLPDENTLVANMNSMNNMSNMPSTSMVGMQMDMAKIDTPSSVEQSPNMAILPQMQQQIQTPAPQITGKRTKKSKSQSAAAVAAAQIVQAAAQMQEQCGQKMEHTVMGGMPQAGNPAMGMGPNAVQQRQQQLQNQQQQLQQLQQQFMQQNQQQGGFQMQQKLGNKMLAGQLESNMALGNASSNNQMNANQANPQTQQQFAFMMQQQQQQQQQQQNQQQQVQNQQTQNQMQSMQQSQNQPQQQQQQHIQQTLQQNVQQNANQQNVGGVNVNNQMNQSMPNQMANQMANQMTNQIPNQMANQMANQMTNQMNNPMNQQMNQQIGNQNIGQMQMQMNMQQQFQQLQAQTQQQQQKLSHANPNAAQAMSQQLQHQQINPQQQQTQQQPPQQQANMSQTNQIMQQLQSSASNVSGVSAANIPMMKNDSNVPAHSLHGTAQCTSGNAMRNVAGAVAAPMQQAMNTGSGMPFNSGNMTSMMANTKMGPGANLNQMQQQQQQQQQQANQPNSQQMTAAQRQQHLVQLAQQQQQQQQQQLNQAQNPTQMPTPNSQNQANPNAAQAMSQQLQHQQINPQQQQQQQQFFNQSGMGQSINRFDRPQINNPTSKQALSMMLRQRHPSQFMNAAAAGAGNNNPQQQQGLSGVPFNMQQQQAAQQRQQLLRANAAMRNMNPAQIAAQASNQGAQINTTNMGQGNQMMAGGAMQNLGTVGNQNVAQNQNVMSQLLAQGSGNNMMNKGPAGMHQAFSARYKEKFDSDAQVQQQQQNQINPNVQNAMLSQGNQSQQQQSGMMTGAGLMQNPTGASLPTSGGNLMNQGGSVPSMSHSGNAMAMNPNQNQLAQQRQQQQQVPNQQINNANAAMLNQAMNSGNMNTLQQMKQNQLNAAGMFSGGGSGMAMGSNPNQNALQQRQQQLQNQQQQQQQQQQPQQSQMDGNQQFNAMANNFNANTMAGASGNLMAGQGNQQSQQQQNQMNFQQMTAQRQAEIMAQRQAAAANRGQFGPMGQNQPAPPYRQNPNMNPTGKPMLPTQAQQQQFQQQQRLRQQQLLMQQQQQQQGMGGGNANVQAMMGGANNPNANRGIGMQTPALLAQLQQQNLMQSGGGNMNQQQQQQFSHQQQQY